MILAEIQEIKYVSMPRLEIDCKSTGTLVAPLMQVNSIYTIDLHYTVLKFYTYLVHISGSIVIDSQHWDQSI